MSIERGLACRARARVCQTPLNRPDRWTMDSSQSCRLVFLGGFLLDSEYLFAFIVSAIGAHVMRQARLVAIRAGNQMGGLQRQMTAPAIPSSLG